MLPLKISVKKRMLRSVFFSVTALFLFIGISSSAEAANKYVRQGASGNGSDWTNAYATLPSRSDPRRYLLYRGWELRQLHLRRQRQRHNADHD
ncbi:MAG: hypothetical protein IPJ67_00260 [Candidatus Moraniibacteriota bacterium]|nr:MAG: hypothetical protein IPJ67_00260 [Candidatus Moranbacteria bacterium]